MNGFDFWSHMQLNPFIIGLSVIGRQTVLICPMLLLQSNECGNLFLKKDFAIETVSKSFLGSYHTRSQFTGLTPNTIQTYIPLHPVTTEM